MNAAMFFRVQNRRTYLILIAVIVITAVLTTACNFGNEARAQADNARRSISSALMTSLNRCARIGLKMTYAGADIKNALLPDLKMCFFAVENMNQALKDGFGDAYMPVSEQLIHRIGNDIACLEDAYRSGDDARGAEESLALHVLELNSVLKSRFDGNGDVISEAVRR